ncbi:hypothetical protein V1524DRAFT_417832 [Lipomyces starkeyi]
MGIDNSGDAVPEIGAHCTHPVDGTRGHDPWRRCPSSAAQPPQLELWSRGLYGGALDWHGQQLQLSALMRSDKSTTNALDFRRGTNHILPIAAATAGATGAEPWKEQIMTQTLYVAGFGIIGSFAVLVRVLFKEQNAKKTN